MKQKPETADASPGFQIAPMIDVVFVIMLFFMVMAGAVKVEHELKTTLPGNAETAKETELPDEVTIGVSETGEITLNEDPVGPPGDKLLENLYNQMKLMGQAVGQDHGPGQVQARRPRTRPERQGRHRQGTLRPQRQQRKVPPAGPRRQGVPRQVCLQGPRMGRRSGHRQHRLLRPQPRGI